MQRAAEAMVLVGGDDVYEDLFGASAELAAIAGEAGFVAHRRMGLGSFAWASQYGQTPDVLALFTAMGEATARQQQALADAVAQGMGLVAVHTAAAAPDRIAAAASFHGGMLVTDTPESPHRQLPRITARLYFGNAVEDKSMTAAQIEILEQELRDWHGAFQSETYEGALHGWTVPGRDVYNELQADRAFQTLVELFDATLKT